MHVTVVVPVQPAGNDAAPAPVAPTATLAAGNPASSNVSTPARAINRFEPNIDAPRKSNPTGARTIAGSRDPCARRRDHNLQALTHANGEAPEIPGGGAPHYTQGIYAGFTVK